MRIWWVLGSDNYYPGIDNFCASFSTEEEARAWIVEEKTKRDHYDYYIVINISERL